MEINKNIKRSLKYLKKYYEKNKFSIKKNNIFIHPFLLYIQKKYILNYIKFALLDAYLFTYNFKLIYDMLQKLMRGKMLIRLIL